jgi:hypothetical protein
MYKKGYKFYKKELSNFKTVMKDTNNNLISADQYDYNCMSYAFGVFDHWLELGSFNPTYIFDCDDNYIDYDCLNKVFSDCCEELQNRYAVRRLTSSNDTLLSGERMIAFRIGGDDFHFVRRNSDGTWTHKPGANYIREMSEEELLSDTWSEHRQFPYISEIAFFAVKM